MGDAHLDADQLEQPEEERRAVERRDSYRVHYPIEERPQFVPQGGKGCLVLNMSERGLCYLTRQTFTGNLQDEVQGILHLRDGHQVAIEGSVVRATEREVALQLTKPIPFGILIAEQRYLRKKYLLWQ